MKTNHKFVIKLRRELFIGIIILLPYIERGFIANKLAIYFENGYIKAIVVIMSLLSLLFLILGFTKKHKTILSLKVARAEMIIAFYLVLHTLFQIPYEVIYFSTMLWIVIPIIYSISLTNYMFKSKCDFPELLRSIMFWFSVYSVFVVLYNIFVFGLYRNSSVRMTASAGGPVIFGYTIAFFYSLLIANKRLVSKKEMVIYSIIFFVCGISTGSRGALWPMLAVVAYEWLQSKITIWKIIVVLFCFFIIVIIDPIGQLSKLFPHLFTTVNTYREFTITNSILIFKDMSFINKVFGYGIGNVFPYQKWILGVSENVIQNYENVANIFGYSMLVQPHNTYIYMILESGLSFIGLLIYYVIAFTKGIIVQLNKNRFRSILPCFIFLFVNFFDSVLCVAPGVAASFWTLLLIHYLCLRNGAEYEN